MSPDMNSVRSARIDRGMTQREMAVACGVSLTTIQRLEGDGSATPRNAKKVADFIGVAVSELPAFKDAA